MAATDETGALASDAGAGPRGAPSLPEPSLDRVLTIPNLITLARLLCLPLFLWLLFARHERAWAAILLAVLGATDWVDGYVARRFNQVSSIGKMFDPTVDRLLFFVAIGGIIADGSAPLWFCLIVLVREVVVAATTVTVTALGAKPVDVTWFGKAGTFALMFAFPWFLAGASDLSLAPLFHILAWVAGIPGVVLSYYAAFAYIPRWRVSLRTARQERATRPDHRAA